MKLASLYNMDNYIALCNAAKALAEDEETIKKVGAYGSSVATKIEVPSSPFEHLAGEISDYIYKLSGSVENYPRKLQYPEAIKDVVAMFDTNDEITNSAYNLICQKIKTFLETSDIIRLLEDFAGSYVGEYITDLQITQQHATMATGEEFQMKHVFAHFGIDVEDVEVTTKRNKECYKFSRELGIQIQEYIAKAKALQQDLSKFSYCLQTNLVKWTIEALQSSAPLLAATQVQTIKENSSLPERLKVMRITFAEEKLKKHKAEIAQILS